MLLLSDIGNGISVGICKVGSEALFGLPSQTR